MDRHLCRYRVVLRRLDTSLVTLLVIAYLTLFGLTMAERGRRGIRPGQAGLREYDHRQRHRQG